MCLIDTILDISSQIFKTVQEALESAVENGKVAENRPSAFDELLTGVRQGNVQNIKGDLQHIGIILDLMNSQLFKSRLVSLDFILTVSKLLERCESGKFDELEEFLNALLMIIECLSSIRKALIEAHEPIWKHLLPSLLNNLNAY